MTISRIYSIDLLKVIALLLVINSHMARLYGDMAVLATGGAIGDAFFFFSAGYLMECKRMAEACEGRSMGFLSYLGNRIWRIYPTVWIWTAFLCLGLGWPFNLMLLLDGDCWFIGCIMAYFVILWFVQRYLSRYKMSLMIGLFVATVGLYFVEAGSENGIYGYSWLKLFFYFLPMLMGSWLAERSGSRREDAYFKKNVTKTIGAVIVSLIVYYILAAFKFSTSFDWLQLLSIPALLVVTYYSWALCNADVLQKLASCRLVKWLSGIGLEAYIIQWSIITICYRHVPYCSWLAAWILILLLASAFHILVKWGRLVINYIF